MKYSLSSTVLMLFMFFNWLWGQSGISLYAFGFVSGICVASWVNTVENNR